MQNMQSCSGNSCQTDGQLGRGIAGGNGTYTGVGIDGDVVRSLVFFLVYLDIGFYDFLVFAMGGYQHVCAIEDFQKTVHFVYQHITGTGTHKQLDTAYAALVQLVEFRIVVIGRSEIARVIDNTFLIQ